MKKLWLGGLAVCLLSACSPSQISKSDVQKALDASKTLNQICVPFQLTIDTRLKENDEITQELLGAREVRFLKRRPDGKHANHAAAEQMEALVDAGIYSSAESKRIGEGEETIRYYSVSARLAVVRWPAKSDRHPLLHRAHPRQRRHREPSGVSG